MSVPMMQKIRWSVTLTQLSPGQKGQDQWSVTLTQFSPGQKGHAHNT